MSAVTHGFFVRRCFPRISLAVSVTILLKVLVNKFTSVYLSSSMISDAYFPPSCPGNVHSCVKAPFHQDVVDLIVMFPIWAVPGPSSRCFVWAKCVSQHQLIVHCKSNSRSL